jgi:hypothetical protein
MTQYVGKLLSAAETAREFLRLTQDIESAKIYISSVKELIDEGANSKIPLCTLPDLADAVNWFASFQKSVLMGKISHGFQIAWPE